MRRTAHLGEIPGAEVVAVAIRKLTGFGATAFDVPLNLHLRLDARCVQAVGASIGECFQPANGLVEIRLAADEAFGARGKQNLMATVVDGFARRLHASERQIEIVQRDARVRRRVLDRQARDAGLAARVPTLSATPAGSSA